MHARFWIGGGRGDSAADHTKAKREMKNPQEGTMKNGRPVLKGQCSVCGTNLNLIQSTKKA
jgi:hypothetical protein